jgi:hypothetical protein
MLLEAPFSYQNEPSKTEKEADFYVNMFIFKQLLWPVPICHYLMEIECWL